MKTSEALKLVGGLSKPSKCPDGHMACRLRNAKQDRSFDWSKTQSVTIVMRPKVVMYLKLYKKHSTGDWPASSMSSGQLRWLFLSIPKNQKNSGGMTPEMSRTRTT